ncbi:hypothetical protein, partial [Paracoccus sp. (in: a-proteobacteria)]|uniref:hypothetical protein n=1 Tax=Paracoccus sp. TaxID=267 RepID=UPI0035ADD77F
MDLDAANQLCQLELAAPTTFTRRAPGVGLLLFEALELELSGYLQIGRIDQSRTIRHPFVQDAFSQQLHASLGGERPDRSRIVGQSAGRQRHISCTTTYKCAKKWFQNTKNRSCDVGSQSAKKRS